jgi:hypothetical protein
MPNADHVKAFRLFELSRTERRGKDFRLDDWEKGHLQKCDECRNVIEVFQRQFDDQSLPSKLERPQFSPARFSVGDLVRIVGPNNHSGKRGQIIDALASKTGDFVYRYSVRLEDGASEIFFGFELWREQHPERAPAVQMLCEEHKELREEWQEARGEWIHFRLTADKRLAGTTQQYAKEVISRAKEKMDDVERRLHLHIQTCGLCKKAG